MKWHKKKDRQFVQFKVVYINLVVAGLLASALTIPRTIFSQQPTTYYRISYYKVVPGKEDVLHTMVKNVEAKVSRQG